MKVSVLGCGRWGTFLAWHIRNLNHEVLLYGRETSENLNNLIKYRKNEYLNLQEDIILSSSLENAINFGEYIIISINSQNLRQLARKMNNFVLTNKTIILAMKGIEVNSGKRLTQVFIEETNNNIKLAVWLGPGHVQAYTQGIPNCMVICSQNINTTKEIICNFNSKLIRLYVGEDLIGNEIGAATKNVIGIGAGMLDGLNYSSLKGALMARGTREISRLIKSMGGDERTAYGLCHLGDYEATLFSNYSHNRKYGEEFIKGNKFSKLCEGVTTLKSLVELSKIYNIELPICNAIYEIIYKNKSPEHILKNLLLRPIKYEFQSKSIDKET